MTEETLETIILGHIAKELKDEIEIGRQASLAKTIMQDLRIYALRQAFVVCSYFKNCGGCGKITTRDRWIQKTERNLKDHYRPICKKCAIWAELPVY